MILAFAVITVAAFCSFIVFLYYKREKAVFDSVDKILDCVFTGNTLPLSDTTSDSRLSRLTHKALRIIRMNMLEVSQNNHEKEMIKSFISDMSHQMKTPLSGVSMYTDLLLEGNTSEKERQEFLLRIRSGTTKLQWLMEALVKMSRLETGAIELVPVAAGLKQTLTDSITGIYGAAALKDISINTVYFEDIMLMHDRKWTCEAFTNILENAVKYSTTGGEIRIAIEVLPFFTRIGITDFGTGIDPDEWNLIFQRFYRGRNARTVDGAGLGLYLASLILQKQGGYILVDSRPGEYTTFSVFLQNCKS